MLAPLSCHGFVLWQKSKNTILTCVTPSRYPGASPFLTGFAGGEASGIAVRIPIVELGRSESVAVTHNGCTCRQVWSSPTPEYYVQLDLGSLKPGCRCLQQRDALTPRGRGALFLTRPNLAQSGTR